MVSPLFIQIAIALYVSDDPWENIPDEIYESDAGKLVRKELEERGFIDWSKKPVATDKLRVYVEHLCAQPFPVAAWVVPALQESP